MKPYVSSSVLAISLLAGSMATSPANAQTPPAVAGTMGNNAQTPRFSRLRRLGMGDGSGKIGQKQAVLEKQARIFRIGVADLQSRLAQGKTFEQIAADLGLTDDQVQNRVLDERKAQIQRRVTSGKITQTQADKLLKRLDASPWPFSRHASVNGWQAQPAIGS